MSDNKRSDADDFGDSEFERELGAEFEDEIEEGVDYGEDLHPSVQEDIENMDDMEMEGDGIDDDAFTGTDFDRDRVEEGPESADPEGGMLSGDDGYDGNSESGADDIPETTEADGSYGPENDEYGDPDEEDDDVSGQSLLSTTSGKVLVGAGSIGIAAILFGGYTMFFSSPAPRPMQHAATGFVSSRPAEKRMPVRPRPPAPRDSAVKAAVPRGAVAARTPVARKGGLVKSAPATHPHASLAAPASAPGAPETAPSLAKTLNNASAAGKDVSSAASVSSLGKKQIQKLVSGAVTSIIKPFESKIVKAFKASDTTMMALEGKISSVKSAVASQDAKISRIARMQQRSSKMIASLKAQAEKQRKREQEQKAKSRSSRGGEKALPAVPQSDYKYLIGRRRLHGFNVIQVSKNGKMGIVETPSKDVNVYFKGEQFHSAQGLMTTQKVLARGALLLITGPGDSKWFIDTKRVVKPTVVVRHHVERAHEASHRQSGPHIAHGWTINASFGSSYLVKTPRGKFVKVNKGESFRHMGKVKGTNARGDLIIGDSVIRKAS